MNEAGVVGIIEAGRPSLQLRDASVPRGGRSAGESGHISGEVQRKLSDMLGEGLLLMNPTHQPGTQSQVTRSCPVS